MKVEGRGHPYRWGTYYVCEVSSQEHPASRRPAAACRRSEWEGMRMREGTKRD